MDHLELRKHMAKALSQISDAPNLLREPDRIDTPAIFVWREDFGEIAQVEQTRTASGPCYFSESSLFHRAQPR